MHIETRAPLYDHFHSSAPFGRQLDTVARRGPTMDESVLRARSSNQRSHRSPRHAVAWALTISLTDVDPGPEDFMPQRRRRSRPDRCRAKKRTRENLCNVDKGADLDRTISVAEQPLCRLNGSHEVGKRHLWNAYTRPCSSDSLTNQHQRRRPAEPGRVTAAPGLGLPGAAVALTAQSRRKQLPARECPASDKGAASDAERAAGCPKASLNSSSRRRCCSSRLLPGRRTRSERSSRPARRARA